MAPTKKPAAAPRKKKANGYQMPVKIPNGEILTDVAKKQWKIGQSIGIGGFGEIYLAAAVDKTSADYKYVVKIVSIRLKGRSCWNEAKFNFCNLLFVLGAAQ